MGKDRDRSRDRRHHGSSSAKRRSRSRSVDRRPDRDRDRDRRDRDRDRKDRSRSRERRDRDRRERSRSPRERRDRSRSRERKRDKEKERKSERKDKEKEKEKEEKKPSGLELEEQEEEKADKEEFEREQERLIRERREKVEKWRQMRKEREAREAAEAAAAAGVLAEGGEEKEEEEHPAPSKSTWNLDDEEDDDEPMQLPKTEDVPLEADAVSTKQEEKKEEEPMEQDDEVDPLDAYMQEVKKDLRKNKLGPAGGNGGVRVVKLNAARPEKEKGEIIEREETEAPVDDFDVMEAAQSLLAKGRQLAVTDHNKIYYRPFRKDFYVEVGEIAKMSKAEVVEYRKSLDGITVRGNRCPKPIKTWAQCGVDAKTLLVLKKHGYEKPTPIQAQAIPAVMSGRDVIGIAKTGSGKTLAFLLPLFRHVLDQPPLEDLDGPIAVIMAPTRELAMQTWKEANKFARVLDLRVVCVYGGVGISEQIADLKRGAEIIVCTPGRMIDMLAANNGKVTNLRRCTFLVLDEADRMFDMGFEPQVMKIIQNIRPDRQTVLFSATFPRQMEALARKILEKPIEIMVGGKSVVCNDVEQHAVVCEEHQKFLKLLELLGLYYEMGNVLVFVEKQEKADDIVLQLMRSGYGDCATLHGGIDQFDRDSSITDFKLGRLKVLVATSVAARGLDVKNLILVVNYDCPNHYEDYVHRVGRTGRAGRKGFAWTFILPEGQEKLAGEVCKAFDSAGIEPPADLKAMFDNFVAQMALEGKEVHLGTKGFSGSGFKYDDAENDAQMTQRKLTKLVHGMEAGGDDDDDEIEAQLSSLMKSKTRCVQGSNFRTDGPKSAALEDKLAKARAAAALAASKIAQPTVEKDQTSLAAEAVMKGEEPEPLQLSATALAKQKAEELNSKLNYEGGAVMPGFSFEVEQQYFEEELEINDFPQTVRYRESIGQVCEYADVGISVKGTHYPIGKEPKPGQDRKLYLLIEARSEFNLRRAKDEILRIMKDAFRQMMATGGNRTQGGRYKLF